ncbi:hypothetical protein PsorP6_016840 [Peronosclerospora sorghi]|uniref:Uncharacterized protein n=1 Tax=Peronosclerospora sorghi TaxID=230839 RepID=A0ACC0WDT3_9STRA|nr:hypothetical protein PsorP6_016840 [Peronosclerospora sorghi]
MKQRGQEQKRVLGLSPLCHLLCQWCDPHKQLRFVHPLVDIFFYSFNYHLDHEPSMNNGSHRLQAHDGDKQMKAEERRGEFTGDETTELQKMLESTQLGRQNTEELEAMTIAARAAIAVRESIIVKELIEVKYGNLLFKEKISIDAMNARHVGQMWVSEYSEFLKSRLDTIETLFLADSERIDQEKVSKLIKEGKIQQMFDDRVAPASVRHLDTNKEYEKFLSEQNTIAQALLYENPSNEGAAEILPSSEVIGQVLANIDQEVDIPFIQDH